MDPCSLYISNNKLEYQEKKDGFYPGHYIVKLSDENKYFGQIKEAGRDDFPRSFKHFVKVNDIEMIDGLPCGHGRYHLNGDVYEGFVANGKFNHLGEYHSKHGWTYKG